MSDPEAFRREEIAPLSVRSEGLWVLRAGAVILISLWLHLANLNADAARRGGVNDSRPIIAAPALTTPQTLFRDLSAPDQRMFRAIHEGLIEAENTRSATGAWPTPSSLSQQGVAPFAADPITRDAYVWTFHQDGTLINYIGRPKDRPLPAFLIVALEPEPGAPPDTAPVDEQHHQLASGDKLHVSVWRHADGLRVPDALVGVPEARGWLQLISGTPPATN